MLSILVPTTARTTRHRGGVERCGWAAGRAGPAHRQEARPQTGRHAATPHRPNPPPRLPRRVGGERLSASCSTSRQAETEYTKTFVIRRPVRHSSTSRVVDASTRSLTAGYHWLLAYADIGSLIQSPLEDAGMSQSSATTTYTAYWSRYLVFDRRSGKRQRQFFARVHQYRVKFSNRKHAAIPSLRAADISSILTDALPFQLSPNKPPSPRC